MSARDDIPAAEFRYPAWQEDDEDQWSLRQNGRIVGEVYVMINDAIKWHCKISDQRDTNAKSIEQAKAECEASFWKDAFDKIRRSSRPAQHEADRDRVAEEEERIREDERDRLLEEVHRSIANAERLLGSASPWLTHAARWLREAGAMRFGERAALRSTTTAEGEKR